MDNLIERDIHCQPFHEQLVVFGQWQTLTNEEKHALAYQKNTLLAKADSQWRYPLPAWLNAMMLGEMIADDLTQYGLFFLADSQYLADKAQLSQLGAMLHRAFPLLDCHIAWENADPELCVSTRVGVFEPEITGDYADPDAFIQAQLTRAHSVFQRGMLRIAIAQCAGEPRWGIWLYHLVADADFVRTLLEQAQQWLQNPRHPEPDFAFTQQMWSLGRALDEQRPRLQRFWRDQGAMFGALALPAQITQEESETHIYAFELRIPRSGVTMVSLALAKALARQGIVGPVLAVTPVTLRRGGDYVASGCYINLIPLVLDASWSSSDFESRYRGWLEHSLLPQEEIAECAGVNYGQALVMLNIIDRPVASGAFRHSPERRSRKPITLTITHNDQGKGRLVLTTRLGAEFSLALSQALQQALTA